MKAGRRRTIALVVLGVLAAGLAGALARGGLRGLTTNVARRTQTFEASPDQVVAALESAPDRLARWVLAERGPSRFRFEVTTPVFGFTDDLTVEIAEGGDDGRVRLAIESRSRVGRGDLGENARHIDRLVEFLTRELGLGP